MNARTLPTPKNLVDMALRKARDGMVILDHNRIIRHMNRAARKLLCLHDHDPVGEIFNHFVMPGEERNISIYLENGRPGIGRLSTAVSEQSGTPVLVACICDASNLINAGTATGDSL
jgi:PAS domain-containing protein